MGRSKKGAAPAPMIHPGDLVVVHQAMALDVDSVERPLPAGLSRDDEPVFLDVDFLDGTKGAHVNISGISGVATKTSYATFLLYSLFWGLLRFRRTRGDLVSATIVYSYPTIAAAIMMPPTTYWAAVAS